MLVGITKLSPKLDHFTILPGAKILLLVLMLTSMITLLNGEEYAYIYTLNDEWVCYNRYQFEDNRMPEVVEIPAPVAA
jgi:hypothetical protein